MRRISFVLLLVLLSAWCPAFTARATGAEDAPRGFVEWEAEPMVAFVGQPVRLRLRILIEEEFLRKQLLPISLRRLDVPVQVEASFLREPRGLVVRGGPAAATAEGTATLALNGGVVGARRPVAEEWDGLRYAVFEVDREFLAGTAGEWDVAAPVLRCTWAERFGEDALGGRVPLDRFEGAVEGPALRLRVLPLPEEGRPADFGGAVGRFTVSAALLEPDAAAPESVRVALRIGGEGNLSSFEAPPFPPTPGLHLLGVRDDGGAPVRTVVYDLARGAGAEAVPALRLSFFEPGAEPRWRVAATDPLPLPAAAAGLPDGGEPGAGDGVSEDDTPWTAILVFLGLLAAVVLLPVLLRPRRRAASAAGLDPAAARAAAEALALRARLADPSADPGEVLVAFLAARLGVLPAAVVSPDLRRRLEGAGASPDLAARTADLVDRLVQSRYGGPPVPDAPARSRALLEEWSGRSAPFSSRIGGPEAI